MGLELPFLELVVIVVAGHATHASTPRLTVHGGNNYSLGLCCRRAHTPSPWLNVHHINVSKATNRGLAEVHSCARTSWHDEG